MREQEVFYEKKLGFSYFGKKIRFFKFQKIYKKNFFKNLFVKSLLIVLAT